MTQRLKHSLDKYVVTIQSC